MKAGQFDFISSNAGQQPLQKLCPRQTSKESFCCLTEPSDLLTSHIQPNRNNYAPLWHFILLSCQSQATRDFGNNLHTAFAFLRAPLSTPPLCLMQHNPRRAYRLLSSAVPVSRSTLSHPRRKTSPKRSYPSQTGLWSGTRSTGAIAWE